MNAIKNMMLLLFICFNVYGNKLHYSADIYDVRPMYKLGLYADTLLYPDVGMFVDVCKFVETRFYSPKTRNVVRYKVGIKNYNKNVRMEYYLFHEDIMDTLKYEKKVNSGVSVEIRVGVFR